MKEQHDNDCRPLQVSGLPAEACTALNDLVEKAKEALGDELSSIVLYGSAAEGKLRATSDINLLVVLTRFTRSRVDPLRETLRLAQVIADIKVMFVLESELQAASEAFAMKFNDIANRHLVLYGEDPVQALAITRDAKIQRLRQVLLNLVIRLRERYAMTSLREEQLTLVLADTAGPLRVSAAAILEIQGTPAASAKEALVAIAPSLKTAEWQQTLEALSTARETRQLPPGTAAETFFRVMDLAEGLRRLAERL